MKRILFSAIASTIVMCIVTSCVADPYSGLSPELAADLKTNIAVAGDNGAELEKAFFQAPEDQQEGMAFLIAYMPEGDRDTLTAAFLLEEVNWAYKARETFPWTKALPDSVFYNDVLPYASMDEAREPWRAMFWKDLTPLVEGVTDIRVAIDTINNRLPGIVNVEYNTKRRRPNQAPAESIEIGMASCSGLTILLVDALRTMGIPARIGSAPMWVSKEGNHSWVEVFIDGEWYFTEYGTKDKLNRSWFLERAGKADKSNPIHWIYATSWKPTGLAFPMVWNKDDKNVHGIDVSDFYIDLYNAQMAEAKNGVPVAIRMFKTKDGDRSSADRVAMDVRVVNAKGDMVAAGKTADPKADMNNYLTLHLPADKDLKVEFTDASGVVKSTTISTPEMVKEGEEPAPMEVELFMK